MGVLKATAVLLVLAALGSGWFVYSGVYDIGADAPHLPPVRWLLDSLRERSIAAHAQGLTVPPLDDPALIAEGAGHYAAMCVGCHLAPGESDSELRAGLYPKPPKLALDAHAEAAEAFWVIKHGIKLTAMPAWGVTHGDRAIWGLVAFLEQLPRLSPAQYAALTAAAHGHDHGDHDQGDHDHGDHEHPDH